MRRLLAFMLHAIAAYTMAWGWLNVGEQKWIRELKGGSLLFLTNQGLAFAWLYMVISLVADVFPSVKVLRGTKRGLMIIAMPLAVVITSIYWSLLLVFPRLILHRRAAAELIRLPLSVDLALHALPLVSLSTDFFVFEPKFAKKYINKVAPAVTILFSVWYASYIEYYATFNNMFPYPFLTYSSFPGRVLIYTATAGIALGCFRLINALHP